MDDLTIEMVEEALTDAGIETSRTQKKDFVEFSTRVGTLFVQGDQWTKALKTLINEFE